MARLLESGPPREALGWLQTRLQTEPQTPYDSPTWDGLHLGLFSHFFPPQQQYLVEFKLHVAADLPGTLVIVEIRRPGHDKQDFQKPLDS